VIGSVGGNAADVEEELVKPYCTTAIIHVCYNCH
jgi:hypothetical protein